MKQFRNKIIAKLFYEILGYLIVNGLFPKKIEFWVEDETVEVVCNVYYCKNREVKGQGVVINNEEEQIHKQYTNQYPTISESTLSNELDERHILKDNELTECERAYQQHLKVNKLPNRGDAPNRGRVPSMDE